jgi:lysozyme
MTLSSTGLANLRANEGIRSHYYNDVANNCTYGVGTLAHMGPCSAAELATRVSDAQVQRSLHVGVQDAVRRVRRAVRNHALTQAQFDAAVSFAYNTPHAVLNDVLAPANRGEMRAVAASMSRFVYIHPRDAHGRRQPAQISPGLVNRRVRETALFRTGGTP